MGDDIRCVKRRLEVARRAVLERKKEFRELQKAYGKLAQRTLKAEQCARDYKRKFKEALERLKKNEAH